MRGWPIPRSDDRGHPTPGRRFRALLSAVVGFGDPEVAHHQPALGSYADLDHPRRDIGRNPRPGSIQARRHRYALY